MLATVFKSGSRFEVRSADKFWQLIKAAGQSLITWDFLGISWVSGPQDRSKLSASMLCLDETRQRCKSRWTVEAPRAKGMAQANWEPWNADRSLAISGGGQGLQPRRPGTPTPRSWRWRTWSWVSRFGYSYLCWPVAHCVRRLCSHPQSAEKSRTATSQCGTGAAERVFATSRPLWVSWQPAYELYNQSATIWEVCALS